MLTLVSRALALMTAVQSTDSLTIEQALARARAERPQVALAAATTARADGGRRIATMIPNPTARYEADELSYTRNVSLVQPLAWVPRFGADRATGRALVARAAADSAQLIADLARDVRRAFYAALAAEESLRLSVEQLAIADSLVVLASRRVSAGDISGLERDQVAQESGRARLVTARAREAARVARVELARAVGWRDSTGVPRPVGSLDAALDAPSDVGGNPALSSGALGTDSGGTQQLRPLPQQQFAQLPALRAALADSSAAAARLRAARIAQLPVPALVAGVEWRGQAPLPGQAPLRGSNVLLGAALPFPLWSFGQETVAEARGAASESAARAAETRLTLGAQLGAAGARVDESAQRARFARDSLAPEAQRIRAGALRLYESGRTGILPVFDAIRLEREIARDAVNELLSFQNARADLLALLGRWQ